MDSTEKIIQDGSYRCFCQHHSFQFVINIIFFLWSPCPSSYLCTVYFVLFKICGVAAKHVESVNYEQE